jgi:hypothetical protein
MFWRLCVVALARKFIVPFGIIPPPRQPDFLANNGFSYVNILYVGTKYEKERNFREQRKEEESSLVGRCILTRQILGSQKGTNLRFEFWPIDFRLWLG